MQFAAALAAFIITRDNLVDVTVAYSFPPPPPRNSTFPPLAPKPPSPALPPSPPGPSPGLVTFACLFDTNPHERETTCKSVVIAFWLSVALVGVYGITTCSMGTRVAIWLWVFTFMTATGWIIMWGIVAKGCGSARASADAAGLPGHSPRQGVEVAAWVALAGGGVDWLAWFALTQWWSSAERGSCAECCANTTIFRPCAPCWARLLSCGHSTAVACLACVFCMRRRDLYPNLVDASPAGAVAAGGRAAVYAKRWEAEEEAEGGGGGREMGGRHS
ncbi:hypothetical protein HYH02_009006 [Chlamydomonas schloesseri]|uniref:Uncharacterized protein n=1 Tax=Chlamydomonas schloesseri TaxID=2026947 RepID=A0A835WAZ2_9CHLO|nr:hypothetical protein HYH02_009006 [Chlamydomonas schloesseri]|eukprot:KAG2444063.1 hypothetical protein HYH02_009006 [Chlamydomonas schloesseri]